MVGETYYLINQLRNGLLDVLILMSPINDCYDLNIIKCKDVEVCFITNNDNPKLLGKKVSLEEISKYPLILPIRDFNDRALIDDYAISNNIYLNPSLELSSYNLIKDFTIAGFGIGVIPEIAIIDEVKAKKICKIDVVPKTPKCNIEIVSLKKKETSFSVQKLIDIITYKNDLEKTKKERNK
jgi:DNA-binding transcriptional LysR family regulator